MASPWVIGEGVIGLVKIDGGTGVANPLNFKKGTKADLPTLNQGEPGYCSDSDEVFIGDGSVNHPMNLHYIEYRIIDSETAHTVASSIQGDLRIPQAMTLLAVGVYVDTAGVTGTATIDVNEAGTSILSTKITIDTGEKSSETAAAAPVISDSAIAADAILTFDIDVIQTTAAKGLVVWLKVIF